MRLRSDQDEYEQLNNDVGTRTHQLKGNFVWDLPDVNWQANLAARVATAVVNDWQVSAVWTGSSGNPFNPTFTYQTNGSNQNLTGSPHYAARIVLNGTPTGGCDDRYKMFDTSIYSGPLPGSVSMESGRNYLTGCIQNIWDVAIARNFRLGGGRTIQIRAEMFNAWNSVQYTSVQSQLQLVSPTDQTVRNPQFVNGELSQTRLRPADAGFGAVNGVAAPRTVQLQARFTF